jgi:DNA repair protein RadC
MSEKFRVVPGPTEFEPHDTRKLQFVRRVETRLVDDGKLEYLGKPLLASADFERMFRRMRENDREKAILLFLTHESMPIGYDEWTGGQDFVALDLRQIFKVASMLNASKIVMCHNHPDEDSPKPSGADRTTCLLLCQMARLMGWTIADFLVMGNTAVYSFKDRNEDTLLRPADFAGQMMR